MFRLFFGVKGLMFIMYVQNKYIIYIYASTGQLRYKYGICVIVYIINRILYWDKIRGILRKFTTHIYTAHKLIVIS